MPERKNQHYVPQFYLDAWATDEMVDTLVLESGDVFNQHLTEVCARNYFYGNPVVEGELANLEGYHSWPIKELRETSSLTDLSDTYLKLLYSFVTTQRLRTKSVKSDIEAGEEFLKEGVEDDLEHGRYEDKITWTDDLTDEEKKEQLVDGNLLGIHHQHLVRGIFGFIGLSDLSAVMLRNTTSREFVVSDAPVIHDNIRFKQVWGPGTIGLANRGLQIFCPIGPHRVLLLYDPAVYRFDCNSKQQVVLEETEVVNEVNLLQFHNADSIIMFNSCSEEYVSGLLDRMGEARRRDKRTEELETEKDLSFETEYAPHQQAPGISPDLPSCTVYSETGFETQRGSCRVEEHTRLVHSIFQEAVFSDVSVIYAIRFLCDLLDLDGCDRVLRSDQDS